MGKVLIIKNNNEDPRIYQFAEKSYIEKKIGYYNTLDGSLNEKGVQELKERFDGDGLVLMITYDKCEPGKIEEIQDVFIGSNVNINEKNNIEYTMKVHLSYTKHNRTIESIIDKIDLSLSEDFDNGCYVMMSDMENLYQELRERIITKCKNYDLAGEDYNLIEKPNNYVMNVLAQKDIQSIRVFSCDLAGDNRTEFQRDRERVVNCKAFRRLVDKAQIFGAEKGDYFRTRMTHSLEVNQIAKAIAYALGLNLDLTEAIALGHDLGHTPFGHQGERTLDDILSGKIDAGIILVKHEDNKGLNEKKCSKISTEDLLQKRCFGGFKHNYQSARILTELEEKYKEHPGLNVSVQVVEGVLKHTKLKLNEIEISDFLSEEYISKIKFNKGKEVQVCSSIEGQVVAIADEIAQRGHDVDDALTSGVMTINELLDRLAIEKCSVLRSSIEEEIGNINNSAYSIVDREELKIARIVSIIINYFVENTIKHSVENIDNYQFLGEITMDNEIKIIEFPEDVKKVNDYLEKVVQKKVICNSEVARADYNASMIVQTLFKKYYCNPRLLHSGTVHKIFLETLKHCNNEVANSAISLSDGSIKLVNMEIEELTKRELNGATIMAYLEDQDVDTTSEDIIIFEKRKILVRAIVDYIAGMTDGYALEEYEKLK